MSARHQFRDFIIPQMRSIYECSSLKGPHYSQISKMAYLTIALRNDDMIVIQFFKLFTVWYGLFILENFRIYKMVVLWNLLTPIPLPPPNPQLYQYFDDRKSHPIECNDALKNPFEEKTSKRRRMKIDRKMISIAPSFKMLKYVKFMNDNLHWNCLFFSPIESKQMEKHSKRKKNLPRFFFFGNLSLSINLSVSLYKPL